MTLIISTKILSHYSDLHYLWHQYEDQYEIYLLVFSVLYNFLELLLFFYLEYFYLFYKKSELVRIMRIHWYTF